MTQFFWTLLAMVLLLNGCAGATTGSDKSPSGDDDDTSPSNMGVLIVHATVNGEMEDCQVNTMDLDYLGDTEEEINVKPGKLDYLVGRNDMLTLDNQPIHVARNGDYTAGGNTVMVQTGPDPTESDVGLFELPQYHCESYGCNYPYDGGPDSCSFPNDSENQWIHKDTNGILHGSETDSFGGAGGYTLSQIDDDFIVESNDGLGEVVDSHFDPETLEFGYVATSEAFEVAFEVICRLR